MMPTYMHTILIVHINIEEDISYVIKHMILAPDTLDLENLDFVSVGKFMKS